MTKHCMFSLIVYHTPENFTRPLVAMVVTFCMSAVTAASIARASPCYTSVELYIKQKKLYFTVLHW